MLRFIIIFVYKARLASSKFMGLNMTLKKNKTTATGKQPGHCETDIESCHENVQDLRYSEIAEKAYYKAQARNFAPGYELDDWLAAENEMRWY
jgi:hypothetical protein